MQFRQFSLIVPDLDSAVRFFSHVLELPVSVNDGYAEVVTGALVFTLLQSAVVPMAPAQGVLLQFEVDDMWHAVEQARARGAQVLRDPAVTEWDTESAYLAGPADIVVELYRPAG